MPLAPQRRIHKLCCLAFPSRTPPPAPAADKGTLIRRAFYDLIGLPPTPEEIRAFVEDQHPDAFARAIDDLLSRPQYGEKWGRHWLDVVSFPESSG